MGTWITHLSRLLHPLTGSTTWAEYEGTSVVQKVWDGRVNLVELEANGPAGHIEALSLRLYNLQSHQWSLNSANSKVIVVRYADDIVMGFQHEREAKRFMEDMRQRLEKFALSLHPEKTRLIEFGRFAA
jgi:hypothetical protein